MVVWRYAEGKGVFEVKINDKGGEGLLFCLGLGVGCTWTTQRRRLGQDLGRWFIMERISGREGIDYLSHLILQAIGIKLAKVQEGLDWSH